MKKSAKAKKRKEAISSSNVIHPLPLLLLLLLITIIIFIIIIIIKVIDMGGEAISSNEYLGVGKVTEFRFSLLQLIITIHTIVTIVTIVTIIFMITITRYGLKMAQCIRSNDFNCLGGIYDQATNKDFLRLNFSNSFKYMIISNLQTSVMNNARIMTTTLATLSFETAAPND